MAAAASRKPRSATAGWARRWAWRHSPLTVIARAHQPVAKMPRRPIACSDGMVSLASFIKASLKMNTTTDADIARMPRVFSITCRSLAAGHLRQKFPMLVAHRHDREPRLAHQLELLELGIGLDGGERHRLLDRLDRLHVDGDGLALLVGRIGIGRLHYLGDADDLLALARVIEEAAITHLHRLEVGRRLKVAHAGPRCALVLHQLVPGIRRGLRLDEPMSHFTPLVRFELLALAAQRPRQQCANCV